MHRVTAMNKKNLLFNDENGSVMVAAIMILVLLTIVGMAAMNTSTTESSLSVNTLLYQRAFYTAEAGFEHTKGILKVPFTEYNQAKLAAGETVGSWTFALDGSMEGVDAADKDVAGYDGGVFLLQNEELGGIKYTVRIWDNDDGDGAYDADVDGRIMVRITAWGGRGEVCSIESLIEGASTPGTIEGYKAQAGAGAGKSYRNNDLNDIDVFHSQMDTSSLW